MTQIDGKLYDMINKLMHKKPSYTETQSTVLPKATYKAHYLIVDKNWYEISDSFCNVFLNVNLISPNGNTNKDYSTYKPTKKVLEVCRMCLKNIKDTPVINEEPVIVKKVEEIPKAKILKTIIKDSITGDIKEIYE